MEGEAIGMVLARASELRSKISDCIDKCGAHEADHRGGGGGGDGAAPEEEEGLEGEEVEEEAESLISIRDALESLEQQLSALQALQQQQRYEREAALTQIDRSRMTLLSKLKEYKGEDLEVIHEASTFASGSIERDEDLLLPPYPSHLDDLYPFSRFGSRHRSSQDRVAGLDRTEKKLDESEKQQGNRAVNRSPPKGPRLVGLVAKCVLTIVSIVSVLSLAGFKPKLETRGSIMELFSKPGSKEREVEIQCPPGKVLVMEGGKPRCLVKERVEIPFEFDIVTAPDISYGFG